MTQVFFNYSKSAHAEAPEAFRKAFKLCFEKNENDELFVYSTMVLIDVSQIADSALDVNTIRKDLKYVDKILRNHPETLGTILRTLRAGTEEGLANAADEVRKAKLTEADAIAAGGGLMMAVALLACAILAGCASAVNVKPKAGAPAPVEDGGVD